MDDGCRQVLHELELYLDGECVGDLDRVIALHLEDCPPCFERAEFHREVRMLIARKCTDTAPPGLIDRVQARLWGGGTLLP